MWIQSLSGAIDTVGMCCARLNGADEHLRKTHGYAEGIVDTTRWQSSAAGQYRQCSARWLTDVVVARAQVSRLVDELGAIRLGMITRLSNEPS